MAHSSQKDLSKIGKEAFALLSEFQPRKRKACPTTTLLPVQNCSANNEQCIDVIHAARLYGGYLFTTAPEIKTVELPKTKGTVHSVYQYYYQRSAA
jgi:hypothetical protein